MSGWPFRNASAAIWPEPGGPSKTTTGPTAGSLGRMRAKRSAYSESTQSRRASESAATKAASSSVKR